uniref:substrate-binding domain-containing protein n=1 Tax=Eshraghiella crossota TaxID=45851 RepID=UPI004029B231
MRISFVVYDGYFEKCSKMVNLVINHYDGGYQALFEKKVTAVFAVSDFYALEFMRFLQSKGIQIPKDIQLIGFDDNIASKESNPPLTTIHQESSLRAKTAIRCLEAMRDGAECKKEIVLPVELIKRESTRKL